MCSLTAFSRFSQLKRDVILKLFRLSKKKWLRIEDCIENKTAPFRFNFFEITKFIPWINHLTLLSQ